MNITETLATLLFLVLCYLCIAKTPFFRSVKISTWQLFVFFTLQILASLALYLIYSRYYSDRNTADIFKFYNDAELLYNQLFLSSPLEYFELILGLEHSALTQEALHKTTYWFKPFETHLYNDNRTIIRFNLFVRLFSFGIYGVHALFFSFLSFIGLVSIFKGFEPFFKEKLFLLKIACFLIPSVLLCSSGVLKESILIFALGLFILQLSSLLKDYKITLRKIFVTLGCLGLLFITKPYVLFALIPSLSVLILWELRLIKRLFFAFILGNLMIMLPVFLMGTFLPAFNVSHIIFKMQQDFINVAHLSQAKSYFNIAPLDGTYSSLFVHIPEALFNSLLRPFSFYQDSILTFIASCENLIVFILFILSFVYRSKIENEMRGIWLLLVSFCLFLLVLIGLTVPVEGAIVRYKVPVLPFFLILFFSFTSVENLKYFTSKLQTKWKKKLRS
jgi:hypothetical protein